jgi:hypothetical protein
MNSVSLAQSNARDGTWLLASGLGVSVLLTT